MPLAFLNPGDVSLVPDPGYPVYSSATSFAGGESYLMPLEEKNDYLLQFDGVSDEIRKKAKLLFFNYPNNPTSAVADPAFFDDVVSFCAKENILACHDAAYTEVYFGGLSAFELFAGKGRKGRWCGVPLAE